MSEEKNVLAETVAEFRRFNRFHTRLLGLFNRRLLGLPITLAEARILYEIASEPGIPAAVLSDKLGMDSGQLSRIIGRLIKDKQIERQGEPGGRTPLPLRLTASGKKLIKKIEATADEHAAGLIKGLTNTQNARLRGALAEVRTLLNGHDETAKGMVRLREAKSSDLGWIVTRHAEIYGREHGFGDSFALYVLKGLAEYAERDRTRSRVWIAESGGAPMGAIGIVEQEGDRAQMRWLLVEPQARGLGVGRLLVDKALSFCREQGFREIFLWTINFLIPARNMYRSLGFTLVGNKEGEMGGVTVTEEMWRLELGG